MQRLAIVLLSAHCVFVLGIRSAAGEEARRPNVLLIVADDLGYGELGCYGGKEIPTPNLDALAAGGVRFTSGYVTAPFCAASRAALLTGRYQTRFGFEFNPTGAKNLTPGIGLPVAERTLADRLRDAGYVTGIVGKWHQGGTAEFHPQRRGFDEFFGFLNEGHYYVPPPWTGVTTWLRRKTLPDGGQGRWTSPDGRIVWSTHLGYNEPEYDPNNPLLRSSQPVEETSNLTEAFTREACDFVRRHREQPFFLYLAYNAVHSPMQGADDYMQKFAHIPDVQRRIFAAMLAQLDDGVGRVLAAVSRRRHRRRHARRFHQRQRRADEGTDVEQRSAARRQGRALGRWNPRSVCRLLEGARRRRPCDQCAGQFDGCHLHGARIGRCQRE